MYDLNEKRRQRGQLVTQMRALQAKAEQEKRAMTSEEGAEFDRIDKAQEDLGKEIDGEVARRARLAAAEAAIAQTTDSGARPGPVEGRTHGTEGRTGVVVAGGVAELRSHFDRIGLRPEVARALLAASRPQTHSPEYYEAWEARMAAAFGIDIERRSGLQADLFRQGGALVPPTQWLGELIKAIDDEVFVRRHARIIPVMSADSLGVPSLDQDPDDGDWTPELKTGSETDLKFGNRELRPHPFAKRVKVSKTLMRKAALSPEGIVRSRVAYKAGVTQEKGYLTGDGNQKPLGIFTASDKGVPTSRDVSTGNTSTAIKPDGLIEAKHFIKAQYWPRLRWTFHRDAIRNLRKEKLGTGEYLWNPGLIGGVPDRILELPYDVSEFAPNTFTSGLYVGALCDWSQYWIADGLNLTVEVLDQLYAETNQMGFIARYEGDGQPVLAEAFARVKLG